MEKKTAIKISTEKLVQTISESIKKVLNESMTYNQKVPLNEMARLNKKDGSDSPFPSNKYKIWVQGESSPHKVGHIHIMYPQEGWQIKVFIEDGQLWQVVNPGKRGMSDTFSDVIRNVQTWFQLPTKMPGRFGTNQEAARDEWDACNDD